ncbi:thermonuclease family protein [Microbacterium rhizomatis]|uniref:TNase-like domain-containing protein n=1 Tax=Microbacterium rhizomatis TaxID=1631477 RepID=A0A5J5J2I1_9MICO|nr:thermonuclease family protein [Microbacterium rhizomatis]KAA9107879.1 hypothetical protein F6B43_10645 [Microbacterium rhizomatis]
MTRRRAIARTPGVSAIAVAVLAAAVLAPVLWVARSESPLHPPGVMATGAAVRAIPPRPDAAFALTVRHIYDGDTIQAEIQHPNDIVTSSAPIRIRLIGIDTPEGTPAPECWADEARRHLAELLPEGSTVWAAPDRDTWDHYGRRLLDLWTDDGRFVPYELVAAGDAQAIRIRPNVAHDDLFTAAQAKAQAEARGRWGVCP